MKKVKPIDVESQFNIDELFFSKTDKKGVILSGNSVFTRVSGFTNEELIGAPHNLIRHPDMPKVVFKLLWDTIGANRPIGAYVKNMSKSGSYYWVFAVALPVPDGYISFRLKPSSELLSKVQGLYPLMLAEEKINGMEGAGNLLFSTLKQLGIDSYEQFMSMALVTEMSSRTNIMDKSAKKIIAETTIETKIPILNKALSFSKEAAVEYDFIFQTLSEILSLATSLKKYSAEVLACFTNLSFLSINMAAAAERAGSEGRTLSEVSVGFEKIAMEVQRHIKEFDETIKGVFNSLTTSQFQIGTGKLQIEMIRAFVVETIINLNSTGFATNEAADSVFLETYRDLTKLSQMTSHEVLENLRALRQSMNQFLSRSEDLLSSVNTLNVIRITGKIEVAQLTGDNGVAFGEHINQMGNFITELLSPLREVVLSSSRMVPELGAGEGRLVSFQRLLTAAL